MYFEKKQRMTRKINYQNVALVCANNRKMLVLCSCHSAGKLCCVVSAIVT